MNKLKYKEMDALVAIRRCIEALQLSFEPLDQARNACDAAGFDSEVRGGLSDAADGLAQAQGALDYTIKLIEGT